MNSRERVLLALNHKEPDRVPFDLGGTMVTGIHHKAYVAWRQALGLPPRAPQTTETRTGQTITSAAAPDAEGWVEVCDLGRLLPGDVLRFEHRGATYAIYRTQIGQLFASAGKCTHGNAQLADGFLQGACIECPKHNGRFDVRSGSVLRPPPRQPLRTYPARERDGRVWLNVAAAQPAAPVAVVEARPGV